MTNIEVFALEGIGEVAAGDDLISVIAQAYANYQPQDGDVLVVTSKIVSKAEARTLPAEDRAEAITAESFGEVATNGPTRIVPGSQWWAPINVPYVNIGDWTPEPLSAADQARVPADLSAPYPGEMLVEAPAGSAIICNSSMWHSGTLKTSDKPRRMLHLTYTRRDLPQQLLQLDYLTPELYNRMSPTKRYLLEIEPPAPGDGILRQPKKDHQGWWN